MNSHLLPPICALDAYASLLFVLRVLGFFLLLFLDLEHLKVGAEWY